jgi:hypothetical protein
MHMQNTWHFPAEPEERVILTIACADHQRKAMFDLDPKTDPVLRTRREGPLGE